MNSLDTQKTDVAQAGENLFNFTLNREDVKVLAANLPQETTCKPAAVEFELQLLKIIATGWALSFFLADNPHRDQLAENFWHRVHRFSAGLSETTGHMTGHDIDYFQIIKSRLDLYVATLTERLDMTEPAAVIGPAFAEFCGAADDVFVIMAGARMFITTITRVKEYLAAIELEIA